LRLSQLFRLESLTLEARGKLWFILASVLQDAAWRPVAAVSRPDGRLLGRRGCSRGRRACCGFARRWCCGRWWCRGWETCCGPACCRPHVGLQRMWLQR
jgi:hypothetical protein